MPFVSKEVFAQQEKQAEIQSKIANKKEQIMINESAKEPKKQGLNLQQTMKVMKRDMAFRRQMSQPPPQPKPISLSEIKKQLEIEDMMEQKRHEEIEEILDDTETKEIKAELIDVLSYPMESGDKRKLFKYKLQNSNTINKYVNDNVMFRLFNRANNHIKFCAIYAIKYGQTCTEYKEYQRQVQLAQEAVKTQVNEQKEKVNEQPKEQSKEEEVSEQNEEVDKTQEEL